MIWFLWLDVSLFEDGTKVPVANFDKHISLTYHIILNVRTAQSSSLGMASMSSSTAIPTLHTFGSNGWAAVFNSLPKTKKQDLLYRNPVT